MLGDKELIKQFSGESILPFSSESYVSRLLSKNLSNLTPASRVLRKLIVTQLVKNFPAFYGTRKFVNVFK